MRQQAVESLDAWVKECGVKEAIDGEVFVDALKSGSPFLKAEVFGWMAAKLQEGLSLSCCSCVHER